MKHRDEILLKKIQSEIQIAYELMGAASLESFLGDEMRCTILVDKAYGNDIVALAEQTFGNVVATRRILIIGVTYLLAVQIGDILVEERT